MDLSQYDTALSPEPVHEAEAGEASAPLLFHAANAQPGQAIYKSSYAVQYQTLPTNHLIESQAAVQSDVACQPELRSNITVQDCNQAGANGGHQAEPTAKYVAAKEVQPPVVVIGQPSSVADSPNQEDPRVHSIDDLLCLSIITTLGFNLILGIIAIFFSIRVRDAKRNSNYQEARSAYCVTLTLNVVGIVVSAIILVLIIVIATGVLF